MEIFLCCNPANVASASDTIDPTGCAIELSIVANLRPNLLLLLHFAICGFRIVASASDAQERM